jgi:hypothetical protein
MPVPISRHSPTPIVAKNDPAGVIPSANGNGIPGWKGPIADAARFLGTYIVMPTESLLLIAAWVAAAWLYDKWDRFPHLVITSPEKRCGKTTLLDLLALIVPRPRPTTNLSPAVLYRLVTHDRPTLLMDESQSLSRRGSEASEVIREILNAGISKGAVVLRCGGERCEEIQEFSVYSPKVIALIGALDSVLADRCLPIELNRKTGADAVQRYRSRVVEPIGRKLHDRLEQWAVAHGETAAQVYDDLEPFPIDNDRMAELLLPLQAVLSLDGSAGIGGIAGVSGVTPLAMLRAYANGLDERDRQQEMHSDGVRLLAACRDIFERVNAVPGDGLFMPTVKLISDLIARDEEPWARYTRGGPITDEALAKLLRPYGIKSGRNKTQKQRGYFATFFEDAWSRYLAPAPHSGENPATPASPPNAAIRGNIGRSVADRQKAAKKGGVQ